MVLATLLELVHDVESIKNFVNVPGKKDRVSGLSKRPKVLKLSTMGLIQMAAKTKTGISSFDFLYSSLLLNMFKAFTQIMMSFNSASSVISTNFIPL